VFAKAQARSLSYLVSYLVMARQLLWQERGKFFRAHHKSYKAKYSF
jgi:hypothetical protein